MRQVGGEGARGRGRGGDARTHNREGDDERYEVNAERLVRVERGTRGARIFRYQLEIAEGGDEGDDECHQERQPYNAADLLCDLAGERVNPGAENVADDEEQEQPGTHDPTEAGFNRSRGLTAAADGRIRHWIPSSSFAKIQSGEIRAVRPAPRLIRCDGCDHPLISP